MVVRSADDYLEQLKGLLPKGLAWTAEAGSVLELLLLGMSIGFARVDGRVQDLLDEADPRTTNECIADWEKELSLPDNCGEPPTTLQQRRQAVVSKFISVGGQNPQYFIDVAAAYGFTITITEFFPFRFGVSHFGDGFNGGDIPFTWQVNAPPTTPIYFTFGQSFFGEPFVTERNDLLECLINRLKPAQTEVIFNYA